MTRDGHAPDGPATDRSASRVSRSNPGAPQTARVLDRLRRHLDRGDLTCVLCDHGVALATAPRWGLRFGPNSFLGVAQTVHAPGGALGAIRAAIETVAAGVVLVIDPQGAEAAVWGENLTLAAQARRAAGVVVAGYVRDVPRLTEIGLSIVAWGAFPRRSEDTGTGEVGGEIGLGWAGGLASDPTQVFVCAGDVIVVDLNGVVVIPQKHFESVANDLDAWIAAEGDHAQEAGA